MEARALAAHEPAIAAAVRAADDRAHRQLEGLFAAGCRAGEWPAGTDPALAARLFTAGLYGLMAQWHLAPGSFSWEAAAAALADGSGAGGVVQPMTDRNDPPRPGRSPMTQTAGPDLNKGCCAAALTRPARQVHLAVLAAFAETGRRPTRGELERIARAVAPIRPRCWPSWPGAT